jgi:hypothetical protein
VYRGSSVTQGGAGVSTRSVAIYSARRPKPLYASPQVLADARRDLDRRAALPEGIDPDVLLRQVATAAEARADEKLGSTGTAISRVLPAFVRAAIGLGVSNPKLWEADVKPLPSRKVDREAWFARVRQAARVRESGDVLQPTLVRLAEVVWWSVHKDGVGFARQTLEQLGKLTGCCQETARKGIRFLERHGLLDTFNILSRRHGFVRRVANLYLIRGDAAELEGTEQPPSDSLLGRLTRYASLFGLRARRWGLNATPAPVGYRPRPERPLPS